MADGIDLKKLFADPDKFSFSDENSLISDEAMTEIIIKDLPKNFVSERALDHYAEIMSMRNPDLPDCAWAESNGDDGKVHILLAFKHAVDAAETLEALELAVENEIVVCGAKVEDHPYFMAHDTGNKYPEVEAFVNGRDPAP